MRAVTTRWTRLTMLAAALGLTAVACGEGPPQPAETGTLEVALVTTGEDGATYRLPPGTFVFLSGGSYRSGFELEGDGTVTSLRVPTGSYSALLHVNGLPPAADAWTLERSLDGAVETVPATLVTPNPAQLTVAAGAITSLVLSFRVVRGGVIVFEQGKVEVSAQVATTTGTGGRLDVSYPGSIMIRDLGASAPAELDARLPGNGSPLGLELEGQVAGPWEQIDAANACAPFEVTRIEAEGDLGGPDLFLEASGGQTRLCVNDSVGISLQRHGAPNTATFSDLTTDLTAIVNINANLGVTVFDGETLDLSVLGTHSGAFGVSVFIADRVTNQTWARITTRGTHALTFTPAE